MPKEEIKRMHNWYVGDKIKFAEEKQKYTVQACSNRYLICTKPFNPKRTVLYSIVDLVEQVRGRDNLIFGFSEGYETRENCEEALRELENGGMEVSHRNRIALIVEPK